MGTNQLPAVVYRIGTTYFNGCILPCAHEIAGQVDVRFPGSENQSSIQFRHIEQFPVILCGLGLGLTGFQHHIYAQLYPIFIAVAYCHNLNTRLGQNTVLEQTLPAVSHADNGNFYGFFHNYTTL